MQLRLRLEGNDKPLWVFGFPLQSELRSPKKENRKENNERMNERNLAALQGRQAERLGPRPALRSSVMDCGTI